MKEMKRLLALVLCFVMLVGVLPISALAEETDTEPQVQETTAPVDEPAPAAEEPEAQASGETIYVLAGGDFQEAGDHTASAENVQNILATIQTQYSTMDGFLFIGDYDCETHGDSTETTSGIAKLMETVQAYYSNINHENSILAQGNHDATNEYIDGSTTGTYGYDLEGYAAFVLNEDQYPNGGGTSDRVQSLANTLNAWLEDKIVETYNKPIFIVSHLPLAFNPRTNIQGDGMYAKYIFDVLNNAAAQGLNIIFLHGHNHAYGYDEYLGGHAIYLAKGDSINIAVAGSKTSYTTETLNFTYMNAGYTGYYNESGYTTSDAGTDKLSMTVFAITDTEVTVGRYTADGTMELKAAGEMKGDYINNVSVTANTATYATTQTIALTEVIGNGSNSGDTNTGVANGWVEIPATTAGYQYVLDTDGIDYGESNKYIIVAPNDAKALYTNGTAAATAVDVTISGNTATTTTQDYEYYFYTGSTYGTVITKDGTNGLYQSSYSIYHGYKENSLLNGFTDAGSGLYRIYDTVGTNWSLTYSDGWTVANDDTLRVRLYKYSGPVGGGDAEYASISGQLSFEFSAGTTQAQAEAAIKEAITGYTSASSEGSDPPTLDDSALTWTWASGFNAEGNSTMTISYNGVTLGTVTAHVAVTPGTGSTNGWVTVQEATSGYKYVLDTDGYDANQGYLIVGDDEAYIMGSTVSSGTAAGVTDFTFENNQSEIIITTRDYEWTINSSGYIYRGNTYLRNNNGTLATTTTTNNRTAWTIASENDGRYTISSTSKNTIYRLRYSSGFSLTTSDSRYVRLYKYEGTVTQNALYASLEGTTSYTIPAGTMTSAQILAMIKEGLTGYTASDANGTDKTELDDSALTWTWNETLSPSTEGNYTMTVSYEGKTLGTVNVCIQAKKIASVEFPAEGYVDQYASKNANVKDASGNNVVVKVTYEGGSTSEVPLTLNLLTEAGAAVNAKVAGDHTGLTINYAGVLNDNNFTLHVNEVYVNNYPEYPDEGAVGVNKTATGIDFQSSGVAQVELSVSGVPIQKGADVIIMLDTSSSMKNNRVDEDGDGNRDEGEPYRYEVLNQAMANLITQLQQNGPDGEPLDIRIAIGDFNGFYGEDHTESGTPYDRDTADKTSDAYYIANSYAKVFTGDESLGAGAFQDVQSYTWTDLTSDDMHSGTNYDYAMDAIYQMGAAIKAQNQAEGKDRDLYVVFMSDGAAMQWNYYHSQGASNHWKYWITGDPDYVWSSSNLSCTEHLYYFNDVDSDGDGYLNEHRMANAIKGSEDELFEVIRKSTAGIESIQPSSSGEENMYLIPGLGVRAMWSISFDATDDVNTTAESMVQSIGTLASHPRYAYNVASAQELGRAFTAIGTELTYAAYNARFEDQMGDAFTLQLSNLTYLPYGETDEANSKTIIPTIEVIEYDIYTRQEYDEGVFTDINQIGTRKGTYTVKEVVIFSEDGTKAYSTLIDADHDGTYGATLQTDGSYLITDTDDNILADANRDINGDLVTDSSTAVAYYKGVIYASNFMYNTTTATVNTAMQGRLGLTIELKAESFYWYLDSIQTTEKALRYYVYLDGSMEGTREAGSYATNNYATLYYDNYMDNPCEKPTTSPAMAWQGANVSYAFYLVNKYGEVIVNQTTGELGSFANKIAVTAPVVYQEIYLNNTDQVQSIEVASLGVLPDGYELYDEAAVYTVEINSNATGGWEIEKGTDKVNSTYVTQYLIENASAYSNALNSSETETENDYTHTVVWFAVLWSPQALPDTVVIDYGLPVEVNVLKNDMFGDNGKLVAVGKHYEEFESVVGGTTLGYIGEEQIWVANTETETPDYVTSRARFYPATYGKATITTDGKVVYQLNDTTMYDAEKLTYAVHYTGKDAEGNALENQGYYYDTLTIIPATTIYFEDEFMTYSTKVWDNATNGWVDATDKNLWTQVGTTVSANQGEDRPGEYSLPEIDANNVYGSDKAYETMASYSMGSANKATVDYDYSAWASFDFYGTGFDVISLTSSTTGTLYVEVKNKAGDTVKNLVVDTYYGYTLNEAGEWVPAPVENSLYQVPVMKVSGLTYGKYHVDIKAIYEPAFDHVDASEETGTYELYLDAVRIYDPAYDGADNQEIEDAYVADGEGWPEYHELRDKVIPAGTFTQDVTSVNGVVYIDGKSEEVSIADYDSFGPNNELYLTQGNAVAFKLGLTEEQLENVADVQIAVKSADGKQVIASCFNASQGGEITNEASRTINTTTDLYISAKAQCTSDAVVVLKNSGEGIMSITNIKITYKTNPAADAAEESVALATFAMEPQEASYALMALSLDYEEPDVEVPTEPEIPETTVPEETEPETTVPEETEPEATIPEETQPETTVPEETEPEETEPDIEETIGKIIDFLKDLFKKWW